MTSQLASIAKIVDRHDRQILGWTNEDNIFVPGITQTLAKLNDRIDSGSIWLKRIAFSIFVLIIIAATNLTHNLGWLNLFSHLLGVKG